LAVAGIAHPENFFEMLRSAGATVVGTLPFPDHHRYGENDIATIDRRVRETDARLVLTTEKDAVKFAALGALPFGWHAVPLALQFDPPDVVFESVRAVLP
jgi:tetraacyldisaccharide 4'-kinase